MKYLVIFLFVFSVNSYSAICVYESGNTTIRTNDIPIDQCTGYVVLSAEEYNAISITTIVATLKELFEFSVEDFAYFNAICLIGFISGHSIGRVSRLLGKT